MQISPDILALEMPGKGIKDSASTRADVDEVDVSVDDEGLAGVFWTSSKFSISERLLGSLPSLIQQEQQRYMAFCMRSSFTKFIRICEASSTFFYINFLWPSKCRHKPFFLLQAK